VLTNLYKTPWPWFGGKADAAEHVWSALGDVDHYAEPFAGSLAVLLRRPHPANRTYHSETVNDADGLICNAWRAIAADPDAVAEAASWPVCEADLMARHLALLAWRTERTLERLMADPSYYDARMAGWWAWGQSCWIGGGWCSGDGPWIVGDDGRITKRSATGAGVARPGVSNRKPTLANNGQGVNRPQTREPGVARQLPHLASNGQGVNRPQTREPGVKGQRPHIGDNGQGVNRPQTREPGVSHESADEPEYHPMTMPELRRWLRFLSARLRHVRVLNGDWTRLATSGALQTLPVRQGGHCGVFLDPPYTGEVRADGLYAVDNLDVAHAVREWCLANGDSPRYRIVLAGFDTEHAALEAHGWRVVEWFRAGFLKGGMAQQNKQRAQDGESATNQHRERLWLSPHCLGGTATDTRQQSLFGGPL